MIHVSLCNDLGIDVQVCDTWFFRIMHQSSYITPYIIGFQKHEIDSLFTLHSSSSSFNTIDSSHQRSSHFTMSFFLYQVTTIFIKTSLSLLYKGRGSNGVLFWNAYFAPLSYTKLQIHLQIKGGFKQKYQKYNYNNHSQVN